MSSLTQFEKDPRFFKREISAYYFFTRLLTTELMREQRATQASERRVVPTSWANI